MVIIEWRAPFQRRPSFKRFGPLRRFMWGYLGVGWVQMGLPEFLDSYARAARAAGVPAKEVG